jgi:hypothetical protein
MNAFWRDYWLMWRYAFLYQNLKPAARPGFYVALSFVLIPLTLLCLFIFKQSWPFKIAFTTIFYLPWFCTYWLLIFVRGAANYNTNTCARLVPRIRRHAIRATILTWWLTTLTFVLLYVACVMLSNGELPLNPVVLVSLCLIVGAILLFFLLWASPLFSKLIFIPGFMIFGLLVGLPWKYVSEFVTIWFAPWLQLMLLMLALMAVGYYCVNVVFRRGGERLWRFRGYLDGNASLGAGRQYNRMQSTGVEHQTQPGTTASAAIPIPNVLQGGFYAMALMRDCAPGAPRTKLIMHVLGPSCVQGKITDMIYIIRKIPPRILARLWLPVVGPLLSGAFFLVGFVRPFGAKDIGLFGGFWVILSLLVFVQLKFPKRYVSFMERTKAEQKLFRLSPGLPSFATLNRQLTMGLVRCALVDWFYWTCGLIALDFLIGTAYSYLLIKLCLCTMCLPFVSVLVHDYSRAKIRLEFDEVIVPLTILVLVFIVLYAWSSATPVKHVPAGWPWLVGSDLTNTLWAISFLLCNAVLTAALVALRLRMLAQAPVAFPAGRRTT